VAEELRRAREADPLGHRVHLALALLYAFLLALSTAPKDVAFGLLLVCAVARLGRTWRCYRPVVRDRLIWLLLAWTAWQAASTAWSPDPMQGMVELRAFRFVLTAFALWPVIEHATWLVVAFLLGVLAQNLVQLLQLTGWFGLGPGVNARLRGLLHPIHTGTVCVIALCWHVAAALTGPTRRIVGLSLAGAGLAAAGLVLSGSRGPWIAAAAVLPPLLVRIAWRHPAARRRAALLALAAVLVAAAGWPLAGSFVTSRAAQAWEDLETAADGRYASDLGRRVASWIVAWQLFRDDPLFGHGAGGFEHGAAGTDLAPYLPDARHAHSMYLHVLGCGGLVGAGLLASIVAVGVVRAWREGTVWALLSWLLAAAFDAYHLAGQMFGVWALLLVLTMPGRPPPATVDLGLPCDDGDRRRVRS
ncbi:MAG: O-antigen ligase family protein, partial [Planctomycetota bacterium]|jgi:O-antigen ligase